MEQKGARVVRRSGGGGGDGGSSFCAGRAVCSSWAGAGKSYTSERPWVSRRARA